MDEEQHSMGGGVKRPNEDYEEDEGDMGGSQLKKRRGEGPQVEMRILVPSKNAGAIIGKGGENIKRLRNDFKASISVPDSGGPERILTVCSDAGSACAVLLDVVPHLAVEERRGRDENADCDIRMLVHQSQAGCVIGRAGFKIKELREQTGANIRVYSMCCPRSTERVIMVSGKPQIVVNCIATIFDLLQTAPPKGPIDPYEPDNFDESLVNDYGGFTMAEGRGRPGGGRGFRGGGGGGGGPRMGSRGGNMGGGFRDGGGMRRLPVSPRSGGGSRMGGMGMGGGGGGGGGMGGFGRDRGNNGGGFGSGGPSGGRGPRGGMGGGGMGRGDFDSGYGRRNSMMDDDGYGDGFGMGGGGGGGPRSRGGMGRNGPGMGGDGGGARTTTQVSIPKEYAGAIIGKSGSRIQQVRRESGADITIAEALPGSNDRIITITGSSDQIQSAQFLLQLSMFDGNGDGAAAAASFLHDEYGLEDW